MVFESFLYVIFGFLLFWFKCYLLTKVETHKNITIKGSLKNKFAELAFRFGSDMVAEIERSHRNSELF